MRLRLRTASQLGPLRSLSRAMFLGFVRDRAALVFSILIPILFLLLFGSIYKSSSAPRVSVIEVGQVSLLNQAEAAAPGQLGKVLTVTHSATWRPRSTTSARAPTTPWCSSRAAPWWCTTRSPTRPRPGSSRRSSARSCSRPTWPWRAAMPPIQLTTQQVEDKSLKPIQYLAPGLLGWAIASGGAFGASITLVSWRQNKLLRRLRLAPISVGSVVLARVGVSLAVAMVQLAAFLAIATLPYFGLKLSASWWMAIPVVICGTLAFMAIGLLVGSFAKTQQAATAVANVIILPMAFLGGAFIPLDFAPAWIREVSYAMPLRYLVTGMQNVMARGEGPASALPAIGILLGLAAVLTVISVRVFRWDAV